jgi:hypothetical protein
VLALVSAAAAVWLRRSLSVALLVALALTVTWPRVTGLGAFLDLFVAASFSTAASVTVASRSHTTVPSSTPPTTRDALCSVHPAATGGGGGGGGGAQFAQGLGLTPTGFQTNDGRGRAYGAELIVRHERGRRFFGWLSYTLMRGEQRDEPGQAYHLVQFDQTHILTAVGSYKLGLGFELGLRFRLVSGNPTTPTAGSFYDADRGSFSRIQGALYSDRLPLFHQLDVRLDKLFTFRLWTLALYLDIQNIYNHRSVEAVQYNYDYTKQVYLQGLPIIPALGAKGTF